MQKMEHAGRNSTLESLLASTCASCSWQRQRRNEVPAVYASDIVQLLVAILTRNDVLILRLGNRDPQSSLDTVLTSGR